MPMRSKILTGAVCVALTLAASTWSFADDSKAAQPASKPSSTTAKTESADAARIDELIKQLTASKPADRTAAADALRAIGVPALKPLTRAAAAKDPEMRGRAKEIVEAIENSLDGLLFLYRCYDLPLPPKNAKLIRYEVRGRNMVIEYSENGGPKQKIKPKTPPPILAFEAPPRRKGEPPYRLRGVQESRPDGSDLSVEEIPAEPAAIEGLEFDEEGGLLQAIQCHARGWDALAASLFKASESNATASPRDRVRQRAWGYWVAALSQPDIDRAPATRHLQSLIQENKALDTAENKQLLQDLQAALVPSRAKPGSVEALIDDLVNYDVKEPAIYPIKRGERYERVARLGFDAVPALIAHLGDRRLTRGVVMPWNDPHSWNIRVGDLALDILEELSQHAIDEKGPQPVISDASIQAWWQGARKIGEEKYLLQHVLDDATPGFNPNQLFVSVIAAKYPKRLAELYQTILEKRPELDSSALTDALRTSQLPPKEKLELLRRGATHKRYRHRFTALTVIRELDKDEYNSLLLDAIKQLPTDVEGEYWQCPEVYMARLVRESEDPRVWSALEAAARRASVGLRLELLNKLSYIDPVPAIHARLRLLRAFLEDKDLRDRSSTKKFHGPCAGFNYDKIEVRDFAAEQISWLVGINAEVKERAPAEWEELRNKARAAADRILQRNGR
jgi:hypothetical protein